MASKTVIDELKKSKILELLEQGNLLKLMQFLKQMVLQELD